MNGTTSYGLDPVGNRTTASSSITGVSSGSWGYNADDELTAESYDLNGNVTATGGKTFAYDAENHLVSMNGGAVQLAYDAFRNRVAKTGNGVTTCYLVEDDVNSTGYPQVPLAYARSCITTPVGACCRLRRDKRKDVVTDESLSRAANSFTAMRSNP